METLAFVSYQFLMLYGLGTLFAYWGMREPGPRMIPELLFLPLGMLLPLAVWLLSMFYPLCSLFMPLSLGYLFARSFGEEKAARDELRRQEDEDLRSARAMLARDGKNAAAHALLAHILARRGERARAAEHCERAEALSPEGAPDQGLAELRLLIERPSPKPARLTRGLEPAFFLVGLCYLPVGWAMTVNVCSLMLFTRWLRSR